MLQELQGLLRLHILPVLLLLLSLLLPLLKALKSCTVYGVPVCRRWLCLNTQCLNCRRLDNAEIMPLIVGFAKIGQIGRSRSPFGWTSIQSVEPTCPRACPFRGPAKRA